MATGEAAGKTGKVEAVAIRECETLAEMRACFALQKEVWGFSDADLIPVRMFVVANKIGGQVMGAFDGRDLVGFALAIPATRNGHLYLHSHMLAVREGYRNSGLGRRLKLFQREDALTRKFELMEWTFDPLEIKNAYLNIEKLGAIARRYNVNQYGITSSPLQGGLPTDRLVAEWWLNSRRVGDVLAGKKHNSFDTGIQVLVPAEIYAWKASKEKRGDAQAVQSRNREHLMGAFEKGLSILGYERDDLGNGKFLLSEWNEKFKY